MSIFYPSGQNRLLALEQELLWQRSHKYADKLESEQEWIEEHGLEEDSNDESEIDEEIELVADDFDETEPSSGLDVYHSFMSLERSRREGLDSEVSALNIPEHNTAHHTPDQPNFVSYEALAMMLTDPNRSVRQSIASYEVPTETSGIWEDSTFECNPFASTAPTSASLTHSLPPDLFVTPEAELSIAPSPSLNLQDIELPELDSSDFADASPTASPVEESLNGEPSYATLSWMLQESRQRDFQTSVALDNEADDLFLDVAPTIDIGAEAIADTRQAID